jgi:hypothetical protein
MILETIFLAEEKHLSARFSSKIFLPAVLMSRMWWVMRVSGLAGRSKLGGVSE